MSGLRVFVVVGITGAFAASVVLIIYAIALFCRGNWLLGLPLAFVGLIMIGAGIGLICGVRPLLAEEAGSKDLRPGNSTDEKE